MAKKKASTPTPKRVIEVMTRLVNQAHKDGYLPNVVLKLESLLDDLLSNDFFGTEGQCDPRGDLRDSHHLTI